MACQLTASSSHPDSANYGKHLTAAETTDLFAPSKETVKTVWDWLVSSGIEPHRLSQSRNKQACTAAN
jgi:tripeptidyl-peptidase I